MTVITQASCIGTPRRQVTRTIRCPGQALGQHSIQAASIQQRRQGQGSHIPRRTNRLSSTLMVHSRRHSKERLRIQGNTAKGQVRLPEVGIATTLEALSIAVIHVRGLSFREWILHQWKYLSNKPMLTCREQRWNMSPALWLRSLDVFTSVNWTYYATWPLLSSPCTLHNVMRTARARSEGGHSSSSRRQLRPRSIRLDVSTGKLRQSVCTGQDVQLWGFLCDTPCILRMCTLRHYSNTAGSFFAIASSQLSGLCPKICATAANAP